jgi:hypothetical protein
MELTAKERKLLERALKLSGKESKFFTSKFPERNFLIGALLFLSIMVPPLLPVTSWRLVDKLVVDILSICIIIWLVRGAILEKATRNLLVRFHNRIQELEGKK